MFWFLSSIFTSFFKLLPLSSIGATDNIYLIPKCIIWEKLSLQEEYLLSGGWFDPTLDSTVETPLPSTDTPLTGAVLRELKNGQSGRLQWQWQQ